MRGGARESRGLFPAPRERRLRPCCGPSPEAANAPAQPRPSRPGRAARWIVGWGLRRPGGGLQRCLPPDLVRPSRVGGARRSSETGSRSAKGRSPGAAAAPLEAGDVGEAVAAAAEAALRTWGKLLADRTLRRDVREPPLPPLTPERSWAQEGRPCAPPADGPAGSGRGREAGLEPGGAPGGVGREAGASARRGVLEAATMH